MTKVEAPLMAEGLWPRPRETVGLYNGSVGPYAPRSGVLR